MSKCANLDQENYEIKRKMPSKTDHYFRKHEPLHLFTALLTSYKTIKCMGSLMSDPMVVLNTLTDCYISYSKPRTILYFVCYDMTILNEIMLL